MMVPSVVFHMKQLANYPDIDFKQIELIALQNSPFDLLEIDVRIMSQWFRVNKAHI